MSNKDNLWRLQDEEGRPAADKPKQDITFKMKMSDGEWREVQSPWSINFTNGSRIDEYVASPVFELGSIEPEMPPVYGRTLMSHAIDAARISQHVINNVTDTTTVHVSTEATERMVREQTARVVEHITEQVRVMTQDFLGRPPRVRTETIEQTIPDIGSRIAREVHRYQERFYDRPQYISLDREAYRSFWLSIRNNRYAGIAPQEESFMGITVICNVTQGEPIMALGSPIQEGIEGRLYNE